MPEQGGDCFEAHASVDRLGCQGVAQLVRVNGTDTGSLGDRGDVAVNGAPLEGLSVVAFDEPIRPRRGSRRPVVHLANRRNAPIPTRQSARSSRSR